MPKPNFIVYLTDDQGYGDLSCMGATDFVTPHLDALAARGARCADWYSNSPVCSPSRASLLTGRYPGHAGVRAILAGHRTATGLPSSVPAMPKALKKLGYQTALFGKWHLGTLEACQPQSHGFDTWYGHLAGCIDYYSHIFYWGMNKPGPGINPTHDLWDNGREVFENGAYFTELIVEKAIAWIRQAARDGRPFFLYLPFNAPHYPMHAPKKYVDRFAHLAPDRRIMAAMISAVDDAVGEINAELVRLGVHENTCQFFMADNGPSRETRNWLDGRSDPYYGGTAGKLKGHKFSLYEGGMRVPGIWSWPARIPGGQVLSGSNGIGAAMDVFPTLLRAAGGDPSAYELDGSDLLPMLAEGKPSPHANTDLYWEMNGQTAVRRGKWKLVLHGQLVEGAPPEDSVHLSDLEADMGERTNLKDKHPDLARELTAAAETWRAALEARWKRDFVPEAQGVTALDGKAKA
ncbi:MAG: sulfatase-like hydrolase/transferase [Planctomycetes bacterium]|nr:sulfatase-like hydrolase/transferase [Planctomycetota bacterium]